MILNSKRVKRERAAKHQKLIKCRDVRKRKADTEISTITVVGVLKQVHIIKLNAIHYKVRVRVRAIGTEWSDRVMSELCRENDRMIFSIFQQKSAQSSKKGLMGTIKCGSFSK